MQIPQQPHEDEHYIEQISEPLYEFDASAPSEEAIRQGLVYPPPPSFYQNVPVLLEPPSLPAGQVPQMPLNAANVPPAYVPIPPAQSPVKRSRTWIWIVVSTLSIVLLVCCGLCGWGFYTIFSSAFQQATDSIGLVDDYYSSIQAKSYTTAYNDLAPQGSISGLTLDQFTQRAQALDDQYGPVLSYTLGSPQYSSSANTGPDLTHFSIIVNVSRAKLSYSVLLTVSKIRGNWKISEFDRI